MATKNQIDHLMHGVVRDPRVSEPRTSLSMGKEALHDREGKQKSKPSYNPFGFTGTSHLSAQQRTVAPFRTGVTPQLSSNKRKREATNVHAPTEPHYKKPRTSVVLTPAAGGSIIDSGVEGLLLGQETISDTTKASKLLPSITGNRLENWLEGREPSAIRQSEMSSDTDELVLRPRTTGKQRGEVGGPNDCIIDLGKPKPNPRGRSPCGFNSIDDRVRQFEQQAIGPLSHRDQHAQPPRTKKVTGMRPRVSPNMSTAKTRPQRKDIFDDPFVPTHFTKTPSKAKNVQTPTPQRDPGEEITVECRMPVELWYLGVERKVPEHGVEGTQATLHWEATGKTGELIVTTVTEKGSETVQIDINDLELWAPIKEGRGALFVLKTNSPFYRQHRRCGSFVEGGDDFGRAMFFRFRIEEWEREKDSLVAFLTKVKEHNAYGKRSMKEYEDLFKSRKIEARNRKAESPLPLVSPSPSPSPSTPNLVDMESSPPPPTHPPPGKKHAHKRVVATPRPARQTRSAAQRENTAQRKELEEVILAYPFTGTGGVEITKGDLNRLKPGEFLNDTLVEFSLKHWLHGLKETNAELADEVHVFSTFFYKRLKTGNQQQGYANVRKWTSKVDIFKKKYLIVPINERLHWYLAIILFPGNAIASVQRPVLAPRRSGRYDKSDAATLSSRSPEFVPETPNVGSPATSNTVLPPESDLGPESADEMEHPKRRRRWSMNIDDSFVEVQPMENEGSVKKWGTPRAPLQKIHRDSTEPVDSVIQDVEASLPLDLMNQTWILTFDSLGGTHQAAINALQAYLKAEALDKKDVKPGNMPPIHGKKVPTLEQPNSCDCGVYVGQVVETIFKSPATFWQLAFSKEQEHRLTKIHSLWDVERFEGKRDELYNLIMRLSEQWKEIRNKTALAPLPNSSTPPASSPAAKEKDIPPLTPNKRKARSAESKEVPDEDDEVIILDVPATKRRQKSPRKKPGSDLRRNTSGGALRFTGPGR